MPRSGVKYTKVAAVSVTRLTPRSSIGTASAGPEIGWILSGGMGIPYSWLGRFSLNSKWTSSRQAATVAYVAQLAQGPSDVPLSHKLQSAELHMSEQRSPQGSVMLSTPGSYQGLLVGSKSIVKSSANPVVGSLGVVISYSAMMKSLKTP